MARWRRIRRCGLMVAAAAMASAGVIGGCNYVATATLLVHGPPKRPAAFSLDAKKRTVLFVDDRSSNLPRRVLRDMIAETAEQTLLDRGVLAPELLISHRGALAAAAGERFERLLSRVEVGEAVGAEVLIYATVDAFTLSADGTTFVPAAALRLKVLDVVSGERLWPEEDQGKVFTMTMFQKQGTVPDRSTQRLAEEELARYVGVGFAQVFHEHDAAKSNLQ